MFEFNINVDNIKTAVPLDPNGDKPGKPEPPAASGEGEDRLFYAMIAGLMAVNLLLLDYVTGSDVGKTLLTQAIDLFK
jgi:hypothetical protein